MYRLMKSKCMTKKYYEKKFYCFEQGKDFSWTSFEMDLLIDLLLLLLLVFSKIGLIKEQMSQKTVKLVMEL